ncbi:hypothetical protein EVA_14266 [gut metagenome]|uniref:Uncharacterized protein n=1 Tax=gut metagenome TaxID=749906 RepID=J9GE30_9ZZZZ
MGIKPVLQTAAHEHVSHSIPINSSTKKHHHSGKQCREAHTHLVENDTSKDEEEHEYVQEGLRTLHRTEGGGVPTAGRLHQILDRRKDVHKDVGTEHGTGKEQEYHPTYGRRITERRFHLICHDILDVIISNSVIILPSGA